MPRAARTLAALLGGSLLAAAMWMLVAPSHWFHTFPGVVASGPFNGHLVRDLAVAFWLVGIAFSWGAWRPEAAVSGVLAGSAFLIGHAGIHAAEAFTAHSGHGFRAVDVLTVYVPAGLSATCSLLWWRHCPALQRRQLQTPDGVVDEG